MDEQTRKTLEENGVDKISFYYINSPLVNNAFTTCVLINSSKQRIEARGVSICSLLDTFSKSQGKNKALGRAIRALVRKQNTWKINGSGRDDEFTKRGFKVKTQEDEKYFMNEIQEELKRIDPDTQISVISTRSKKCAEYKKYSFEVPISYPVRLANLFYKYKSQYRPVPVGTEEQELIRKMTIFTEPIEDQEYQEDLQGC
jgi:hypothetical protein